jgi:hypothetical protein
MAAGLGFKDFVTGEVLTANDVDGYLMQGVWVFADATARDAAVTSPQEGNFAYLKDTNVTTYYTGSAWANLDTTGMTNPMTTTGDIIYSSPGSTPVRLGIGTASQVLQVNSGATAPEWVTPDVGGMTLISTTTLTGASVTLSSIPQTFKALKIYVRNFKPANDGEVLDMRMNGDSGANRHKDGIVSSTTSAFNTTRFYLGAAQDNSVATGLTEIDIPDYTNTATWKWMRAAVLNVDSTTTANPSFNATFGLYNQTTAITSLEFFPNGGNFTSGTILLYGVK